MKKILDVSCCSEVPASISSSPSKKSCGWSRSVLIRVAWCMLHVACQSQSQSQRLPSLPAADLPIYPISLTWHGLARRHCLRWLWCPRIKLNNRYLKKTQTTGRGCTVWTLHLHVNVCPPGKYSLTRRWKCTHTWLTHAHTSKMSPCSRNWRREVSVWSVHNFIPPSTRWWEE